MFKYLILQGLSNSRCLWDELGIVSPESEPVFPLMSHTVSHLESIFSLVHHLTLSDPENLQMVMSITPENGHGNVWKHNVPCSCTVHGYTVSRTVI